MGKEGTERKGNWWREYTKQHLRPDGEQPRQAPSPAPGSRIPGQPGPSQKPGRHPDDYSSNQPVIRPIAPSRVFDIKIEIPSQLQQVTIAPAQKPSPHKRLKTWLGRKIGKFFFGLAFFLMGRMLKKQARGGQSRGNHPRKNQPREKNL